MTPGLHQSALQSDTAVGSWTLDPSHTTVRITHKTFWGMGTVKGEFTDVHGGGEISADHSVTGIITIAAASVDTKHPKRDTHLRSAKFLDVEKYPDIVMTVGSAQASGATLQLAGELRIKGVREPVTLTAEITELTKSTLAVHVTGSVDRHRFGVSGNQIGMITGDAAIDVDAVFTRA